MTDVVTCTKCDGRGGHEALHPRYGSRDCPEAYILVDCEQCDGTGAMTLKEWILDLLIDLEAFLDNQADAEIDANGRMIGNDAMKLLDRVQEAMKECEK